MRWLLDSNVWIDALAGLPHGASVLRAARQRPEVWIVFSAITRIEVLGFPNLTEPESAAIRQLLNEFEEVPLSKAVIDQTILIRKAARVKVPDALIAASAQLIQATVVTRITSDFERVPGITVVHPDNV